MVGNQDDQRSNHDELVCHRIQKCAERRGLIQAAGQVTVEPIRYRREGKQYAGGENASILLHHIQHDENRDQKNAGDRYDIREIHELLSRLV